VSKSLTVEQLNALEKERDGFFFGTCNYRGLVRRGFLRFAWGRDSKMGYDITDRGKAALIVAGR
jgi:hypothetical protein